MYLSLISVIDILDGEDGNDTYAATREEGKDCSADTDCRGELLVCGVEGKCRVTCKAWSLLITFQIQPQNH